jgi:5'-phosphate synthase pdxT subunit
VKIGILAVQGDFEAHAAMLERLGVETVEVRTPADLEGCDGLILPGGESTTQLQFLQEEGLRDVILKFAEHGGAIFGTCAGAILLATEVKNPKQDSLKLLDMTVLRNAYGRQVASDVVSGPAQIKRAPPSSRWFHWADHRARRAGPRGPWEYAESQHWYNAGRSWRPRSIRN